MSVLFRFRPANVLTIEELQTGYIWFSRPTEYNDEEDSNIIAFAEENENVKEALNRVFSNYLEFGTELSYCGICCFTETFPKWKDWRKFPKGPKGIIIKYDKEKIEQYFINNYALGDCFKKVEYFPNQLIIESSSSDHFDVLWEVDEDGILYKSLRGDIERSEILMDEFLQRLFTRINKRHNKQNELRIILGSRHFADRTREIKGYKIPIPLSTIISIYVSPDTPKHFIAELKKMIPDEIAINEIKPNLQLLTHTHTHTSVVRKQSKKKERDRLTS
jgi:hypothetical protein